MLVDIDDPDLTLDEMFRTWPETAAVFLKRGMLCIGCPVAPFHTLIDACREYQLGEAVMRDELKSIISSDEASRLQR